MNLVRLSVQRILKLAKCSILQSVPMHMRSMVSVSCVCEAGMTCITASRNQGMASTLAVDDVSMDQTDISMAEADQTFVPPPYTVTVGQSTVTDTIKPPQAYNVIQSDVTVGTEPTKNGQLDLIGQALQHLQVSDMDQVEGGLGTDSWDGMWGTNPLTTFDQSQTWSVMPSKSSLANALGIPEMGSVPWVAPSRTDTENTDINDQVCQFGDYMLPEPAVNESTLSGVGTESSPMEHDPEETLTSAKCGRQEVDVGLIVTGKQTHIAKIDPNNSVTDSFSQKGRWGTKAGRRGKEHARSA